jgi:hypothetical protein
MFVETYEELMEGEGIGYHGKITFDSGLIAEILSLTLDAKQLVVTALASGPHDQESKCSYTIHDNCGRLVKNSNTKAVAPKLEEGESVIVTLRLKI